MALEAARRQVLMVPEEALSPRQGRQYVFLVQDGRAVEREVEIGAPHAGAGGDPQRARRRAT